MQCGKKEKAGAEQHVPVSHNGQPGRAFPHCGELDVCPATTQEGDGGAHGFGVLAFVYCSIGIWTRIWSSPLRSMVMLSSLPLLSVALAL